MPNSTGWVDPLGLVCETGDCPGQELPLTDDEIKAIQSLPKSERPLPANYLPKSYIDRHLAQFDNGASRFMTRNNLEKYGIGQRDGTSFVMPKAEADMLIENSGGNRASMENALGLPTGFLDGNELVRVDIPNPRNNNLRIPSGKEAGANELWIPGGKLPDGSSEAVIDAGQLKPKDYNLVPLIFK